MKMKPIRVLAIFSLIFSLSLSLKVDDDLELDLELIKHQPCLYREGSEKRFQASWMRAIDSLHKFPSRKSFSGTTKWKRKLEFEGGNDRRGPKLRPVPGQPACYSIGGQVTVYEEFTGDFSIYLELRNSANKKQVPESCQGQREDGCGGFGSCLYCNACETITSTKHVKAQLLLDDKPIECGAGLKPGNYENIQLVFCVPNIEEILTSQGLNRETFKALITSEDGQSLRSLGMFATIYVFDTDVRKTMQTQQKVEAIYRKSKRSFFRDEPLPPEVYWSLPFNQMIKESQNFVACHKIYGNVKIRATS